MAPDDRPGARPPTEPSPRDRYEAAHAARSREVARCARRAGRISNARLVVFLAGAAALVAYGFGAPVAVGWLWAAAALFAALVLWHDAVLRAGSAAGRAAAFHEAGLARMDGRWAALAYEGPSGGRPEHPYADDLDCLGPGSLLHRISAARTGAGISRLADWLLAPAERSELLARQDAVRELRPRLALREAFAMLGEEAEPALDSAALIAWAGRPPAALGAPALRVAAIGLPGVAIGLGALAFAGASPWWPCLVALAAQTAFAAALRPRVRRVLREVETPAREIERLAHLLALVEGERFAAERLRALRAGLEAGGSASRAVAALRRRIDLLDARRNQLFAPVAALLLWATHAAFALERWRARCGPHVVGWIDALAELEALLSLAGFAFERPDDVFPEIAREGPLRFEAEGLGHPLLAPERCVRNDVALTDDQRLLLVSGSNMSGKSTLLRAVGANAVLALAGAPVCARQLRLAPLRVGASVQLRDSLLAGQSRFYAEIQRLRRIFEMTEAPGPPVLFLLDEILHGTNAQERRVGAERVVRALLARGAGGLVTTHDLALAELAPAFTPAGRNVHFADRVEGEALHFDYRLREGIATQGNALALMRAVGLPL